MTKPWTLALLAACVVFAGAPRALAAEPGIPGRWYATQLHAHSRYSDGYHSAADLVRWAKASGLDAIAITDHNTTKHLDDPVYKALAVEGPILIPAYEWGPGFRIKTKEDGERCHASVWGVEAGKPPIDVMLSHREMLASAKKLGLTVGVNHPFEPRFPWPEADIRSAHAMEVWQWHLNDDEPSEAPLPANARTPRHDWPAFFVRNSRALGMWQSLLAKGVHVTPIATADFHVIIQQVESPCTLVWSQEPTAKGILAGIRAGHVALVERPGAARVEAWVDVDGDGQADAMAGDTVPADRLVRFHVVGGRGQLLTIFDVDGVKRKLRVPDNDWWEPTSNARGVLWARLDRPGPNHRYDRLVAMSGAVYLERRGLASAASRWS